jgi:hypothetical protein
MWRVIVIGALVIFLIFALVVVASAIVVNKYGKHPQPPPGGFTDDGFTA